MTNAIKLYHRLPPFARSAVASLRGYYLNWWRYDANTERLVEEALERDLWSSEKWKEWREDRLGYILERAATEVPFYRTMWAQRRRGGDRASWSYLENWPILEKESLRNDPQSFLADDCSPSKMFHDHTSGTTGTSLDLWLTGDTVKQWYALFEARARRWYGLSRKDRWGIFGGQLVTPIKQEGPPYWVWNGGLNQLYLSSYHISADSAPDYLDAIRKHKIRYLLGYPSAIYALARESLIAGLDAPELDVVITNAEPVYAHQRKTIEEAFSCSVRETYGMAEIVAAASECEHGSLHQWPDTGIIENASGTVPGDLICTGLVNADMPLIRYRVGDSGEISERKCGCGRKLPVIESILGRTDDSLYTADGRIVGRLDPVFKGDVRMKEAQIIQESLGSLTVRFVASDGFKAEFKDVLAERLRERMGTIDITFEQVAEIPRSSNGKFRAVISRLSVEEREEVGSARNVSGAGVPN